MCTDNWGFTSTFKGSRVFIERKKAKLLWCKKVGNIYPGQVTALSYEKWIITVMLLLT